MKKAIEEKLQSNFDRTMCALRRINRMRDVERGTVICMFCQLNETGRTRIVCHSPWTVRYHLTVCCVCIAMSLPANIAKRAQEVSIPRR